MFSKAFAELKRYTKIIIPCVVFNLVLGLIFCLVRGTLTVINYSNTLLGIGGLFAGLGLLSFIGNINNRGDFKQHQSRRLIYKDQEENTKEHKESERKSLNFLMIAAIVGMITILLSGFVLNFS